MTGRLQCPDPSLPSPLLLPRQLRSQQTLSITHAPNLMLQPTISNEMAGEFLSMERINRWILGG